MVKAIVSGTGSYVPEKRLTNADLEKMVETSNEWILERTGIAERRIASEDQASSDLAFEAARAAIADAGLTPDAIDMIIAATETQDHPFPPVACKLQQMLGCRTVPAFDVHLACTGFIAAMQVAHSFLMNGTVKHVLVVGVDTLSRITDYTDRSTCIIFSDGAGAFVLSSSGGASPRGILGSALRSDGNYFDAAIVPGGGSRHPKPYSEETKYKIVMQGNKVFKLAVSNITENIRQVVGAAGFTIGDIDWIIPHQANQRIIDAIGRNLEVPEEKMVSTIRYYGNNSAATVPLAMDTYIKEGRIKRGDRVVLAAFGGGFAWGTVLLEF